MVSLRTGVENSKRLGLTISFMRMLKWWAFPNTQLPSEESRCVWQRYLIKTNHWGGSRATCVQVWMAEQKMDWCILERVLYVHVRIGIKWHPNMMQTQPEVPWDTGEKHAQTWQNLINGMISGWACFSGTFHGVAKCQKNWFIEQMFIASPVFESHMRKDPAALYRSCDMFPPKNWH